MLLFFLFSTVASLASFSTLWLYQLYITYPSISASAFTINANLLFTFVNTIVMWLTVFMIYTWLAYFSTNFKFTLYFNEYWKWKVLVTQSCPTLCDPKDFSLLAPLSMEFFRQEYWSVLSFLSSGDLPKPRLESRSLALQTDLYCLSHQGSPIMKWHLSRRREEYISFNRL